MLGTLVTLATAGLGAQTQGPPTETLSAGLKSLYRSIRLNLVEAADLMPESSYGFKPTPDIRTFGELIGHLANTQYNFCATARGVASPNKQNNEALKTKAELVAALRHSLEFCDAAYDTITDAEMLAPATFGTAKITKGYSLTFNVAHDNEHYGNIVTYLRLKGLVPPSTARIK
jgi:uncharacterized damage-inducible protein DinB